jgi:hypothetical protein
MLTEDALIVSQFVLDSVKPAHLAGSALARPEFRESTASWAEAFRIAEGNGCSLPFFSSLRAAPWFAELPERVQLQVEERLSRERVMLAVLDSELDSALFQLIGAKLPVLVLGAMDLGRRFYADRAHRPVRELELIVPAASYSVALRVLGRGGYRQTSLQAPGGLRLSRKNPGPVLYLRKFLDGRESESAMAALWDRAREGRIPGLPRNARTLSCEDYLIELIQRGCASWAERTPVWLNDLHYLISSAEFQRESDWDQVIWQLAQERSVSATWLILKMLIDEWGTQIPSEVLRDCGRRLNPVRRTLLARMSNPRTWFSPQGAAQAFRTRLLLRDSVFQAIRGASAPSVSLE